MDQLLESEEFLQNIDNLRKKYEDTDQNINTYLDGLYHQKPINYWDYLQTDVLLNIQTPRTNIPDEMVFIMYHQVNEILFKMILWEIQQVADSETVTLELYKDKIARIARYFDMLTKSFVIMKDGMSVEQYMQFRNTLTPASGFQSAQYRIIEFCSTELINLIDARYREGFDENKSQEDSFNKLYWQAAGVNHKTGKKTVLVEEFEKKYKSLFLSKIREYKQKNLWSKYLQLSKEDQKDANLIKEMRHLDYTVNVTWVMAHYTTAEHYLESSGTTATATGGSPWKKYMHPKYQRRMFFPLLWSKEEKENWGSNL